ncbi:MAG TPA: hypothetical protein VFY55_07480 [Nitrososphaeraceae archaeon]|nr:hypothetical protein [Nitrososphaeraceae archaeon]
MLIPDWDVLSQTKPQLYRGMSAEPENANLVVPWSSDGKTVTQILCQSLIGVIISLLTYFSINYALKSYLLL